MSERNVFLVVQYQRTSLPRLHRFDNIAYAAHQQHIPRRKHPLL